jgi:3-isopropylmalate/(R)-2-methylmalate dehydratase large subunit
MCQTFAEKILAVKAGLKKTIPGQFVEISPDVVLSHDNAAPIQAIFKDMGGIKIYDGILYVIVLDHAAPAPTARHAENHRIIREFVKQQGIENFYDIGRGICHQVLVEEGFALPGALILGSDSHTTHAGFMGAFGTGIGRTEMASVWAVGRLWMRVPESIKIVVRNRLNQGVSAKDLSLHIIGDLGTDGGLYKSIEWHGEAIESLDLEQRAVLTNISAEIGAKNSYIPPDHKTINYLESRAKYPYKPIYPDPDAQYAQIIEYDADLIEPMIACPHAINNVKRVSELVGQRVDMAFLGTCSNGRLGDLAAAAKVLEGKRISRTTRMIVIPASADVYKDAMKAGIIDTFLAGGALVGIPGCGPCMGNHMGIPTDGEIVVSTANRNFKGRMGNSESEIYLASPEVVTASAIAGSICHPKNF